MVNVIGFYLDSVTDVDLDRISCTLETTGTHTQTSQVRLGDDYSGVISS